ncbi:MAG: DUF4391 domain-containing protein [Pseudomonadota bacterium]
MTAFFDYPKAAAYGRVLPKTKIYEHSKAGNRLKQLFVDQVDQIVWQYKLAPETINLSATESTAEIQIFKITLRGAALSEDVLRAIDSAIAFPIIFELIEGKKRKAIAAYKRPSEVDPQKWVVSEYFESDWEPEDNTREPLPAALNLGGLYDMLVGKLIPASVGRNEPIARRVERMEAIRAKEREAQRIKARLVREKQFNKRVAINAELRDVAKELKRLGAPPRAVD